MNDAGRVEAIKSGWRCRLKAHVRIALVLEDRNLVLSRESEQLQSALTAHDAARRILHRWNCVDVFRSDAFFSEIRQKPREWLDAQSALIEWRTVIVHPKFLQLRNYGAVCELFENDSVTSLKENLIDQVNSLERARRN